MPPAVLAHDLRKVFQVPERLRGLRRRLAGLLLGAPRREVLALGGVSFAIEPGERVAFLGPNGAGKSTTLRVLTGILRPSSGEVRVLGLDPARERRRLAARIGTVFGQRSQLWSSLPVSSSLDLLARVYDLDRTVERRRRHDLVEAFGIGGLLDRPAGALSLGERMRCEVAASLLHAPALVFLDEPTIGLDVTARAVLRDLLRARAEREGTTLLLTSHDAGDVERVCDRVLVIHRGRLVLDTSLRDLRRAWMRRKIVTLVTAESELRLDMPGVRRRGAEPHRTVLEVDPERVPVERVVQAALAAARVLDLSVEDPPLEEVIRAVYASAGEGPP